MDSKAHSAFQRLMREVDNNSPQNQKLVRAANAAADELCRQAWEMIRKNHLDTTRDPGTRHVKWPLTPESQSGDWEIVRRDNGDLRLNAGPVGSQFGGKNKIGPAEARLFARFINNAGGPERWIKAMLDGLMRFNK